MNWCFVTVLLGFWENGEWGDERQSELCALEWLEGSCREGASPNPASRARKGSFNGRPEHFSQMVVCPLGCSFLASALGDRHLCQTWCKLCKHDLNCRRVATFISFVLLLLLGKGILLLSTSELGAMPGTLRGSVSPTFLIQNILMDSESFTRDRQGFCFTNRMQRHGQMAVTQKCPTLLISNLQLYPTHYLQAAVAFSLCCARATKP